ncbi:MAG: MBL fold metallo-hydrolase [Chloroflexi bacterium]|nr:MBL fold metallo-hydrolase [Chloroflexota bacterium]
MAIVVKDDALQIERLELGPWPSNAYIVVCLKTRDSLVIDAPAEAGTITDRLKNTNPRYILLTHNHQDHTGALAELHSRLKVPLATHTLNAGKLPVAPERLLNDGDTISVGNLKFGVLHTPGHTPDSLCFKVGRYLLSGDTIFPGGPGHTRSPEALRQIIKSITEKIFVLPDDTPLYPGHGDSTVLKKEKDQFAVFASRSHAPSLSGDVVWLTS